jgi:hypothetical protein
MSPQATEVIMQPNDTNNTVGTQITGGRPDSLPDELQESQALDQGKDQAVRPTEIERPPIQDADHLRATAHPRPAAPGKDHATTLPDHDRRTGTEEPVGPETVPGRGPRTGLGRGQ